jgi:hypothetical protein
MSARSKIVNSLVTLLKDIDGTTGYNSDLFGNVHNRLKFWDEVDDYPSVFINAGAESRDYLPGGFKWAYLNLTIRIYVQDEEPEARLEEIFEDIELIVDNNGNLEYDTNKTIEDMKILSITTDEGLLNPIGVGEMTLQIMYDLDGPC